MIVDASHKKNSFHIVTFSYIVNSAMEKYYFGILDRVLSFSSYLGIEKATMLYVKVITCKNTLGLIFLEVIFNIFFFQRLSKCSPYIIIKPQLIVFSYVTFYNTSIIAIPTSFLVLQTIDSWKKFKLIWWNTSFATGARSERGEWKKYWASRTNPTE